MKQIKGKLKNQKYFLNKINKLKEENLFYKEKFADELEKRINLANYFLEVISTTEEEETIGVIN